MTRLRAAPTSATTNTTPEGKAAVRVLAGAVTTPVQVLAYVDLNNNGEQDLDEPSSASKTLVVSSGVPDQNSISLSATLLNVESAYDSDGKVSQLSVRMADAFNNPVPDGTAAIFSTELGSIAGSCNTINGGMLRGLDKPVSPSLRYGRTLLCSYYYQ